VTIRTEGILARFRRWLRHSPLVHLKQDPVQDLRSCVGILDRFLKDELRYPLEWDDFVSWPHVSPGIETVRERVAETERLFFSKDLGERRKGFDAVLAERNRIAAIVGLPVLEWAAFNSGLPPNKSLERTRER